MNKPPLLLTDTHCHLTVGPARAELDGLLGRARTAGVRRLLVPGIDLESSAAAVELAEREPGVYAAVGIHPHSASQWSAQSRSELHELAQSDSVVAIGEIGLDFYRDLSPRPQQHSALTGQLEMAATLGFPVILHNRQANRELWEVLIEWAAGLGADRKLRAGVLHAFSGSQQDAEVLIESGFYLGVAGPVTYPNAGQLRETLKALPLQRLLLETDTPYLAPQPRRGRPNEPAFLPFVAQRLAELLNIDMPTTAAATWQNASDLFGMNNGNQDSQLH